MLLITLCSLIAIFILVFVGWRLIAPAILRTNHKIETLGIDCMEMVEIGGIKQALYIRGKTQTTLSYYFYMEAPETQ